MLGAVGPSISVVTWLTLAMQLAQCCGNRAFTTKSSAFTACVVIMGFSLSVCWHVLFNSALDRETLPGQTSLPSFCEPEWQVNQSVRTFLTLSPSTWPHVSCTLQKYQSNPSKKKIPLACGHPFCSGDHTCCITMGHRAVRGGWEKGNVSGWGSLEIIRVTEWREFCPVLSVRVRWRLGFGGFLSPGLWPRLCR